MKYEFIIIDKSEKRYSCFIDDINLGNCIDDDSVLSEIMENDFRDAINSFEFKEAIGFWTDSDIQKLYNAVIENARNIFNSRYAGSLVTEVGNSIKTFDLFDALIRVDDEYYEHWSSPSSWCISNIVNEAMGRFIEESRWHVGMRREDGCVIENIIHWPTPVIERDEILWKGDKYSYQPIMWFGRYKNELVYDDYWSLCREYSALKAFEYAPLNLEVYSSYAWTMDIQIAECASDFIGLDAAIEACPLRDIEGASIESNPLMLLDKLCLKLWSKFHNKRK